MKQPLVSVIMPAYNASQYIEEAITSVLKQTYENLELIVIDDCSTDVTYELSRKFTMIDSRVKVFKNGSNSGVATTRNRGLKIAQGEYIAFLDSDDIWKTNKIEKQLRLAKNYTPCIVYSSYELFDVNGNRKPYMVPEKTDFASMLKENVIGCSTVLISKEIAKKYSFVKDFYHEDYVYWLNVLREGYSAVGTNEIMVEYRVLEESRSGNKVRSALKRWKIYREYLHLPLIKSVSAYCSYTINGIMKHFG